MTYQFTLQANGFHIVFNGEPVHLNEALDTIIEIQLFPHLGGFTVRSVPMFLRINDLQRFLVYLEEHIEHLRNDSFYESYVFVPLELGFQVHALPGDVDEDTNGSFCLLFLVNIGLRGEDEDDTRVYIGGETNIDVSEVRAFIQTVRAVMEKLQQSKEEKTTG
jgi:hypothetical protein